MASDTFGMLNIWFERARVCCSYCLVIVGALVLHCTNSCVHCICELCAPFELLSPLGSLVDRPPFAMSLVNIAQFVVPTRSRILVILASLVAHLHNFLLGQDQWKQAVAMAMSVESFEE